MNTRIKTTLGSALLLALATTAAAQDRPHRGDGPRHDRGPVVIEEARQRASERAAAIDADGDGFISVAERQAFHEARRAERARATAERRAEMMAARGIDPDSKVAVEDFVARRVDWLEKADTNGDGVVDVEEFRAARAAHRHDHGKGKGRRGPRGG